MTAGRGARAWVLHVDLDQFLAAVELLRRPELRGRPVVIGGDGDPTKRAVVSTASYEARRFGVHSGQPLRIAARRCPDAVFLPVDFPVYEAASAEVMATLRQTDAVVEVMGWDEAFLGIRTDDPEAFARHVQGRVHQATALECSIGIGENKLQAKLATGYAKPAGVFRLTSATWDELLGDQPTDALWGIGAKTAAKLADAGIRTVAELGAADLDEMATRFGPRIGPWLVQMGRGRASAVVDGAPHVARSRSRERTFQEDLADPEEVARELARVAGLVADDVAAENRTVRRVVIKVRYVPFTTKEYGRTLPEPTREGEAIVTAALGLLDRVKPDRAVRLLGVRAEFTS
ncbi:MAG TPA: DNA polymerase IV [Jiangellaceae bacterium]